VRILGIHGGHNATACLYDSGSIVAEVSEERFCRRKNKSGFPTRAVDWLVTQYGLTPENLDRVAVGGLVTPMKEHAWQEDPWERFASGVGRLVPGSAMTSSALVKPYLLLKGWMNPVRQQVTAHLAPYGIDEGKVELVEHHMSHACAAYWLDFRRRHDGDTLVVTLDNTGDGLCGTVNIADASGAMRRIAAVQSLRSVGMMYTAVTRFLGMRPVEDEYKVMGLAPYARSRQAERVYEILRGHVDLSADGLGFVNRTGLTESGYVARFRQELSGFRFDNVAAGVQKLVEELVAAYLQAWSRRTGIRKLAVGGGVFMNVKLNMRLEAMEDFEEIFFLPSCGDEHNAAGAALKCAYEAHRANGQPFSPAPLGPLYLGPDFTNEQVEAVLRQESDRVEWRRSTDIERETARLLAGGCIVGRMAGRMEFGARSLGNRSILARADSLNTVHKINAAIKMRDFWMPFAPAVLWERRHDYVVSPKDSPAPYMILGFPSTDRARRELIAGLHPFDLTCRPQLVERQWNPKFHRLLQHFEELTGYGGLLNTSFNLHGEPVVCAPEDAIRTYLESDLDVLTINDYVVWHPGRAGRIAGSLDARTTMATR